MNIKRAKDEIKNTIEAYLMKDEYGAYAIPAIRQRPVLLIGPPGVGKTQIMEQISQECQVGLVSYTITHHTRQSAIGLPFIEARNYGGRRYSVTEYTMSEIVASIYDKIEITGLREGILFIDEINCVSETLAPTMLQFLQCKTFGNHKIPEGWIIVAAGNPPEFNKSVREFDVVTLDRIKLIHVEPDFEVWREYAQQAAIHPAILSYLEIKPQNFCQIETTVDGKVFATPRGWEDLSRLIEVYEKLEKTVDTEVVFQYIQHSRIAKDFGNYLELYYKYEQDYRVEEILAGTIRESVCNQVAKAPFDERLSVMGLLLSKLQGQFGKVSAQGNLLEQLMGALKQMDPGAKPMEVPGQAVPESALERLSAIAVGMQVEWNHRKEAGLLGRAEGRRYQDIIKKLERYLQTVKLEQLTEETAVWERLKELFAEENSVYQTSFEAAEKMLEHGFDFMEAAFGDSQEMVVFVTGLNTGYYSVRFLQEYQCERYFRYNQRLLFDSREQEILAKIQ